MKHFNTYINEFLVKNHVTDRRMEYVDLGLPSGTKWAICNLGAEKPIDIGDYYMFGATEPSDICNWSNCPFNGDSDEFDYKCFNSHSDKFLDDKGFLLDSADAAIKTLNDGSHIPTPDQLKELFENTVLTIISYGNPEYKKFNNTEGAKLTSKKDISKFIFIPFSHIKLGNKIQYEVFKFLLWSNSIDNEFIEGGKGYSLRGWKPQEVSIERYTGGTIRPVKDK